LQELTCRLDPNRRESWLIYFDDVHVGSVGLSQCLGFAGYTE